MSIDLEAIEARANAATDGPWHWEDERHFDLLKPKGSNGTRWGTEVIEVTHDGGCACRQSCEMEVLIAPSDAEFIANARTDVPDLIAEVRRLRGLLEDAQGFCYTRSIGSDWCGGWPWPIKTSNEGDA